MAPQLKSLSSFRAFLLLALCLSTFQVTHGHPPADTKEQSSIERLLTNSLHLTTDPRQAYSPVLNVDDFLFGEEYEYWVDLPVNTNDPLNPQSLLNAWKERLKEKLIRLGFLPESYSLELFPPMDSKPPYLSIQLGNWESRVFIDSWSESDGIKTQHYTLLEVHASPYRHNQNFIIEDNPYSVYKLIDWFITDIADELGLRYASGHKHVDIQESFGNNLELFFRHKVDIQDKAWLPEVFGCQHDSGMMVKSFVYLSQLPRSSYSLKRLNQAILAYNKLTRQGYKPKPSLYPDNFNDFTAFWHVFLIESIPNNSYDVPNFPANIRIGDAGSVPTNEEAKAGKIVTAPTSGTLEYRFLPTAHSGYETMLINQLLMKWVQFNFAQQMQGLPVTFSAYDPLEGKPSEELLKLYDNFILNLGLRPEDYRTFYRQGCQPRPARTLSDYDSHKKAQD